MKKLEVPSNGAMSDDDLDDDEEDNHSSLADADIATTTDENKTIQETNPVETGIVLKQIRRLSSVEAMPPPPPPPPAPEIVPPTDVAKAKDSNK